MEKAFNGNCDCESRERLSLVGDAIASFRMEEGRLDRSSPTYLHDRLELSHKCVERVKEILFGN